MKSFLKNLYSIYFTLYILWWVSVFIIISNEGFHPIQDIPWFVFFTLILILLWGVKFKFADDNNIIFHQDITNKNRIVHLLLIFVMTVFMIFFPDDF